MLKRLLASRKRPCFKGNERWETKRFDLSGCQLEITLPPHDDEFPEEDRGQSFNLFDPALFDYDVRQTERGFPPLNEGVSQPAIVHRKWNTYGPFWEGAIGFLQINAVVCDISKVALPLNCFNKAQMERLFIHGLYFSVGPGCGYHENKAPVNWQIKKIHGTEWIYCESWAQTPEWVRVPRAEKATRFTAWLATPLFHDKYLLYTFGSFGTLPAEPSNQLMFERIQKIIPSLKLRLSPEADKQKAAAEQQDPHAEYSQHRNPEPWRYYGSWREGDILANEDDIVFEGECTPPPELR